MNSPLFSRIDDKLLQIIDEIGRKLVVKPGFGPSAFAPYSVSCAATIASIEHCTSAGDNSNCCDSLTSLITGRRAIKSVPICCQVPIRISMNDFGTPHRVHASPRDVIACVRDVATLFSTTHRIRCNDRLHRSCRVAYRKTLWENTGT